MYGYSTNVFGVISLLIRRFLAGNACPGTFGAVGAYFSNRSFYSSLSVSFDSSGFDGRRDFNFNLIGVGELQLPNVEQEGFVQPLG
jgi:hypothetical protein